MKTELRNEYVMCSFLCEGGFQTDLREVFDEKQDYLYNRFEDRLILHLIQTADCTSGTDGRSNQVIDSLFWDEYYNGTDLDRERIKKQVKSALHYLYKTGFIRRDKDDNVFLCTTLHVYRIYGYQNNLMECIITSAPNDKKELEVYQHHIICTGKVRETYDDDLSFISAKKTSPLARVMIIAHRLKDQCRRTDYFDQSLIDPLIQADWLNEYDNKLMMTGEMRILEFENSEQYYLEYNMSDDPW
jgi:hypothetical protein